MVLFSRPAQGSCLGFLFLLAQLALHFSIFSSSLIVGRNSKPLLLPRPRWLLLSLLSSSKSWASFSAICIGNFSSHALFFYSNSSSIFFLSISSSNCPSSYSCSDINFFISISPLKSFNLDRFKEGGDLTDFPLALVFFICIKQSLIMCILHTELLFLCTCLSHDKVHLLASSSRYNSHKFLLNTL